MGTWALNIQGFYYPHIEAILSPYPTTLPPSNSEEIISDTLVVKIQQRFTFTRLETFQYSKSDDRVNFSPFVVVTSKLLKCCQSLKMLLWTLKCNKNEGYSVLAQNYAWGPNVRFWGP